MTFNKLTLVAEKEYVLLHVKNTYFTCIEHNENKPPKQEENIYFLRLHKQSIQM
jgi:hypothetical protein